MSNKEIVLNDKNAMLLKGVKFSDLYFQIIALGENTSLVEGYKQQFADDSHDWYLVVPIANYEGSIRALDSGLVYAGSVAPVVHNYLKAEAGKLVPSSEMLEEILIEYVTDNGELIVEDPASWMVS